MFSEIHSPGLITNSQIIRAGFLRKKKGLLFVKEPTFQSSIIPLLRENVCFLRGAQVLSLSTDKMHVPQWVLALVLQMSGHHIPEVLG
jgi:hypothetical protein